MSVNVKIKKGAIKIECDAGDQLKAITINKIEPFDKLSETAQAVYLAENPGEEILEKDPEGKPIEGKPIGLGGIAVLEAPTLSASEFAPSAKSEVSIEGGAVGIHYYEITCGAVTSIVPVEVTEEVIT